MTPELRRLARRMDIARLENRHSYRGVLGAYLLVNSVIAMLIMSGVAWLTQQPFVFPSLGPTAFILFFAPLSVQASPRNVFCGQLIGVASGVVALLMFGLFNAGPDLETASWARTGAVALALGLTAGLMVWLDVPHAPATATTMIVALGLIHTPMHLTVLMIAVVLLIVQAFVINRLAGLPYPWWRATPQRGTSATASGTGRR